MKIDDSVESMSDTKSWFGMSGEPIKKINYRENFLLDSVSLKNFIHPALAAYVPSRLVTAVPFCLSLNASYRCDTPIF